MTLTIKRETIEGKTIYIRQEKFDSGFCVGIDCFFDDCGMAYNLNENYYMDLEKAKKRFNYLKRQAKKGYI